MCHSRIDLKADKELANSIVNLETWLVALEKVADKYIWDVKEGIIRAYPKHACFSLPLTPLDVTHIKMRKDFDANTEYIQEIIRAIYRYDLNRELRDSILKIVDMERYLIEQQMLEILK